MILAEPALRLEMAALGYFFDAAAAAWAAVNEIRVAAAYPDEAHAVCAEYREAQLSELEAVLLNALKRGEQWLSFNSAEVRGHHPSQPGGVIAMSSYDQGVFWQLGQDARTGEPLPPPFHEASARDIACMIHDDLTEVGLSTNAIRKVACALLSVSLSGKRRENNFSTYERGARS